MRSSGPPDTLPALVVERLEGLFGSRGCELALHEPHFGGAEWKYVKQCLDTGWVSSVGEFVEGFEVALAKTCGVAHAVAVVNGTAALQLALMVGGVKPGDEVLVPALTFVGTAAAVRHCGAMPHFVDCEERTLGLDPEALGRRIEEIAEPASEFLRNRETGRRISAVVPVHIFGHAVDMDAVVSVARRHKVVVIEDAAEALGSRYKGRAVGGDGLLSALSFNGNKIVTTGGGGAILTHNASLAKRAKFLTTTARSKDRWTFVHDEVGFNYRMPNINAALGLAQLEQLDGFVAAKRALHERYRRSFSALAGLRLFTDQSWSESNCWLNSIVLDQPDEVLRNKILEATQQAGFGTRPLWRLMHRLQPYAECPRGTLAVSESLEQRIVSLPSSAALGFSS